MHFWPRERFPFIPAMATPIQFQAISTFNNPAWEIPPPMIPSATYFPNANGVDPSNSWDQDNREKDKSSDGEDKSKNWPEGDLNKRRAREGRSPHSESPSRRHERRERGREREERGRDRERGRRHRSRERRSNERYDGSRERRGREEWDRREGKRGREDEGENYRRRERSERRRRSDEDDNERRREDEDRDRNEYPAKRVKRDGDSKFSLEAANYKTQTPNETIMIRGLAQHISENDIRQDIVQCGLMPKDIRLIRKKETGVSRGFAFVEFNSTEEALYWMELKQGVLMLQDMYRAVMQFSIVANDSSGGSGWQPASDWDCPKCFAHNFKKRLTCYKCLAPRPDSAEALDATNEISPHPTTKLMIRNLDPLTNEEELLKEVIAVSNISIQSCQISRDSLTNLSRGVCYLEMKNVLEAIKLYNELTAGPVVVQNKRVSISYCKLQPDKPPVPSHPAPSWPPEQQYTLADVPQLAEYSARMYAANPSQKAAYIQYYTQYYTNQINQMTLPEGTDTNAAAAVAHSAIQMAQTKKAALAGAAASAVCAATALSTPIHQAVSGYMSSQQLIGNTSVGEPDVSSYVYDESSGYYFDQKTGLYYDASSQYYYHSQDQTFLYWDATKKSFMAAPSDGKQSKPGETESDKKKDKEKQQDKVKVAKRIAKDMERWAKTLNQKKEVARQGAVAVQQAQIAAKAAATADVAFAVLERKETGLPDRPLPSVVAAPAVEEADKTALVASYGGGSDSDEGMEDSSSLEDQHTDWAMMACLLCKRQFPTKEALLRHQQLSDLHKQNVETWYRERGIEPPSQRGGGGSGYRDRAKERREKFGTPDIPKPSRLKEKYMKEQEEITSISFEEPARSGIPSENLGSKMLQKMGWSEGMGLGKMNQGRTEIVEAVQRVSTAGLGVAGSSLGPAVGSSYKDNVKRVAMARFSELKD